MDETRQRAPEQIQANGLLNLLATASNHLEGQARSSLETIVIELFSALRSPIRGQGDAARKSIDRAASLLRSDRSIDPLGEDQSRINCRSLVVHLR